MDYSFVSSEAELDELLNKTSQHGDFEYKYDSVTIDLLKKNLSLPDSLYLWVTKNEQFVGFLSCDRDWWEDNCFFLREIFVDPTFQGQGIGKDLMSRCIDHAHSNAATCLVTQTAFENISMQQLCESFGFQKWDNPQWNDGITYKLFPIPKLNISL